MEMKMFVSLLRSSFLLLCFTYKACRCEALQGPGSNARIIPFSERISPDDLPLEHRSGDALLLPDVFSVSRNVTSDLDVDFFFSLFFVFLNDQFEESNSSYTIFAPAGLATAEATSWLRADEKLTEELLMNHIVMGEHLRPELMTSWNVMRTTLGGLDVSFKIDDNGELWVNEVRIVAWRVEGKALIIALEDYLFKQEVQQEVGIEDYEDYEIEEYSFRQSETGDSIDQGQVPREWGDVSEEADEISDVDKAEFIPTPRNKHKNCKKVENKSGLSIFKSITVCTEKVEVANVTEETDLEPSLRKLDPSLSFFEEVERELSFIRGGPGLNYFLDYASKTGLHQLLSSKKTYTVLAPVDEAFQRWLPIDWGFNPFEVASFANVTMVNHVVEGPVSLQPGSDQTILTTIGDREVQLTVKGENTYANGALVRGGMTLHGGRGSVLFLDQVLWVDHDVVEDLNNKFGYLESGPPINSPWNNSQFLSHSLAILEKLPNTTLTALYMNSTPILGEYAPGGDGDGYTLFVPTDEAFAALCPHGSPACASILQGSKERQRMDLLLGHLVGGRMVLSDYNDTLAVTTMTGRNITLTITPAGKFVVDDGTAEGPAAIIGDPIFVYNLGTLIIIDKVLFGSEMNVSLDYSPDIIPETEINATINQSDETYDVSGDPEENLSTQLASSVVSDLSYGTTDLSHDTTDWSDATTDLRDDTTDLSGYTTDLSDDTTDLSDDTTDPHDNILSPGNETYSVADTTTEQIVTTEQSTVISNENEMITDNSFIVFRVKELLREEMSTENTELKENLKKPRQTRIVYINNQRVEIEDEALT